MWAVQSPRRRLRPLVWGWLVHIEYDYTSGLHCGAMRTAHIKNPYGWGMFCNTGVAFGQCPHLTPAYNIGNTPYGRGII